MKTDYKNRVPNGMIKGLGAATVGLAAIGLLSQNKGRICVIARK